VASICRLSTNVLAAIVALILLTAAPAHAQQPNDAESLPPGDSAAPAKSSDDIDKLLDMGDKHVEDLSKVNVASATNPVVEGVSKKEERLSESPGIVDVITAKDIEDFGAKNLYEVL
jgi:hypothetical protein